MEDGISLVWRFNDGQLVCPRKQRKMKLLVQRDEQIQIGAEIFMTPLYGCSEDAESGMPIKYVLKKEKCCCHTPSTLS